MRSIYSAIGFFLIVIFISLIYKLPAQFVYQQLPQNKNMQLSGISGSIWSGHVDSINTPQLTLNNLDWQLSAWALLVGDIDVHWTLDDSAVNLQGDISLSGEHLQISNMKGQIDLLELDERIPEQPTVLGGQATIDIVQAELEDMQLVDMTGLIEWKPAFLLSPKNIELGEFKAELSNDIDKLVARLSDTGGAVELAGDFTLSQQGSYDYSINIGIRDTSVPGLLDGFNQLGQHDNNGRAVLKGNGKLF